jgi:integrase
MSYTGVGRGECPALRWTDLDLDAGTVAIRRSLQQTKAGLAFKSTKTDRERAFTIGPAFVAILRNTEPDRTR